MRWPLLITLLLSLFACSSNVSDKKASSKQAAVQAPSAQVIIQFTNSDTDPEDPELLQNLSKELNGELTFIKRLSGGASLYKSASKDSKDILTNRLNQLGSRDDINYAELDRMRTTQAQQ